MVLNKKNILLILLTTLLVFIFITTGFTTAFAAESNNIKMDNTSIEDDLSDIDLLLYPYNLLGNFSIMSFQEYCYSDVVNVSDCYSLYFYVYNPTQKAIAVNLDNVVNIAVSYDADGNPTRYENVLLKYLDKTDNNRFYKFKITNSALFYSMAKDYNENFGYRRYDVATLQLRFVGSSSATDVSIANTYNWTGYAQGMGSDNSESTLNCTVKDMLTLTLNVKSTQYRPEGTNGVDDYTQDSLTSVYFSISNSVLEEYGSMYAIHAHWLEALTDYILVTGNREAYADILKYVGVDVGAYNDNELSWWICSYPFTYTLNSLGLQYGGIVADVSYNLKGDSFASNMREMTELHYLFYAENGDADSYTLSGDDVQQWMLEYADKYGYSDLILGKYSDKLFANVADEVTDVTILATDEFSLTSEVISQSWWQKIWGNKTIIDESSKFDGIKAIHEVCENDFQNNYLDTCDGLYIGSSDFTEFKKYYDSAVENNETVFLFRFAVDDYYAREAFEKKSGWTVASDDDTNAYFAQETVYLDFDIIDVTMSKDDVLTVIPTVMSPIDIIPDLTPPVNTTKDTGIPDWVKLLLMLVLLVLCLALIPYISPILVSIVKIIFSIIVAPFKFIAWLIKRGGK